MSYHDYRITSCPGGAKLKSVMSWLADPLPPESFASVEAAWRHVRWVLWVQGSHRTTVRKRVYLDGKRIKRPSWPSPLPGGRSYRERVKQYIELIECDCCGAYHRPDFRGDCRDDDERFPTWQVYVAPHNGRDAYMIDDGAPPELFRYVAENHAAMRQRLGRK